MIKSPGLILLAVYEFHVFRIIVPLIDYAINYNYIVTQLCEQKDEIDNNCKGKCHLSKEIQREAENSNKSESIVEHCLHIR